ncbi:hypothetical protein NDU88_000335 [Pleurodeles waltl]|uniref:Uncharacterized protein n=1 Tax=Pleurodeles waltl TaxID=8319 RepID=A0AAV7TGE8_PLEWA|nr:hypothetical protein NDU88_000335 [Pleurodeles waltl]
MDDMQPTSGEQEPDGEPNLKQILSEIQRSQTKISGKIDALSFHMDRMSEQLDKQAEHIEATEHCIAEAEDEQVALKAAQKKAEKLILALQAKAKDLETRSLKNNL